MTTRNRLLLLIIGLESLVDTCLFTSLKAIGHMYIKDTFAIFNDEFLHLSPINGAIYCNSTLIKNFYNLGYITKKEQSKFLPEGDGPVRLIYALFNKVVTLVSPSLNSNLPASHISPKTIARIIAFLEKGQATNPEAATYLASLIDNDTDFRSSIQKNKEISSTIRAQGQKRIKDIEKKLKTIDKYPVWQSKLSQGKDERTKGTLSRKIAQAKEEFGSLENLPKLKVSLVQELKSLNSENANILERYATNQIEKPGNSFVKELAQAIVDSYNAPRELYMPHTTYSILLAFLYNKAVTKQDFLDYFDELQKQLPDMHIFIPNINEKEFREQFVKSCFHPANIEHIKIDLKKWQESKSELGYLVKDKHLYEATVYGQISERFIGELPPETPMGSIMFNNKLEYMFSDCVETAIKNFFNIILYNAQTGFFDPKKIPTMQQAITSFYTTYNSSLYDTNARNQWGHLLQNLDYIAYDNAAYSDENNSIGKFDCRILTSWYGDFGGLIRVPETIGIKTGKTYSIGKFTYPFVKIAGNTYLVVDHNVQLFEIHATMRSIFIILDKFFGTNVFDPSLEAVFDTTNFDEQYIPKILGKLPLSMNARLALQFINFTQMDTIDSTLGRTQQSRGIIIDFNDFVLLVMDGHSECRITKNTPQNIISPDSIYTAFLPDNQSLLNACNQLKLLFYSASTMPSYTEQFLISPKDRSSEENIIRNLLKNFTAMNQLEKEHVLNFLSRVISQISINDGTYFLSTLIKQLPVNIIETDKITGYTLHTSLKKMAQSILESTTIDSHTKEVIFIPLAISGIAPEYALISGILGTPQERVTILLKIIEQNKVELFPQAIETIKYTLQQLNPFLPGYKEISSTIKVIIEKLIALDYKPIQKFFTFIENDHNLVVPGVPLPLHKEKRDMIDDLKALAKKQ